MLISAMRACHAHLHRMSDHTHMQTDCLKLCIMLRDWAALRHLIGDYTTLVRALSLTSMSVKEEC